MTEANQLRAARNTLSKQVGILMGQAKKDPSKAAEAEEAKAKVKANGKNIKQQAINIPVNLRYDIGLGSLAAVYLAAGPQFGFNVGGKHETIVDNVSEWKMKTSNFSVNLGFGLLLLSHLQIGANYNIVCGKTGEVSILQTAGDIAEGVYRGRSNTWQISAAYYF